MSAIQNLVFRYKEQRYALGSTHLQSAITLLQQDSDDVITTSAAPLIARIASRISAVAYNIAGGPASPTHLNVTELLHVFARRFEEHLEQHQLKREVEELAALVESPTSRRTANQLAAVYTLRLARMLCNKQLQLPENFFEQVEGCLSDAAVESRVLEETILVYDASQLRHARLMRSLSTHSTEPSPPSTKRKSMGSGDESETPPAGKKGKSGKTGKKAGTDLGREMEVS